jgi:hypothetical protein
MSTLNVRTDTTEALSDSKDVKLCGCGAPAVEAPCPFAQEIRSDDSLCSCCDECRDGCAADI